jgi:hypothetical protein
MMREAFLLNSVHWVVSNFAMSAPPPPSSSVDTTRASRSNAPPMGRKEFRRELESIKTRASIAQMKMSRPRWEVKSSVDN